MNINEFNSLVATIAMTGTEARHTAAEVLISDGVARRINIGDQTWTLILVGESSVVIEPTSDIRLVDDIASLTGAMTPFFGRVDCYTRRVFVRWHPDFDVVACRLIRELGHVFWWQSTVVEDVTHLPEAYADAAVRWLESACDALIELKAMGRHMPSIRKNTHGVPDVQRWARLAARIGGGTC